MSHFDTISQLKKIFPIALMLFWGLKSVAQEASMGNGTSGGGAAYVCRNPKNGKVIGTPTLYDTYAAANDSLRGRILIQSSAEPEVLVQQALSRLSQRLSKATMTPEQSQAFEHGYSLIRRSLNLVERDWLPLTDATSLPFRPDFNPKFQPRKKINCQLETVAHYYDSEALLRVDMEIYNRLSNVDKAALKWHEAVYKLDRVFYDASTSELTRNLVGELFSLPTSNQTKFEFQADMTLTFFMDFTRHTLPYLMRTFYPQISLSDVFFGEKSLVCNGDYFDATPIEIVYNLQRYQTIKPDGQLYIEANLIKPNGQAVHTDISYFRSLMAYLDTSNEVRILNHSCKVKGVIESCFLVFPLPELLDDDVFDGKKLISVNLVKNYLDENEQTIQLKCTFQ